MKKVLFLCMHNSARSQMAEGLLKKLCGKDYEVYSAGINPKGVNPYAIKVMAEIGIDISGYRSKSIEEFKDMEFDYVITVCDETKEVCPFFPNGKKYLHKAFIDPSGFEGEEKEKIEVFRRVRDEIKKWIEETFCKK
ncbi:MAG: arsenate reductase ArsC [candidate division WOR-3 bacterium]|uniref:Arsenate reductase ArsC n=1 Tax=candidate division WOR-3 bacterium TaxID=2052148 RepID=A0A7V4ABL3_UNCW3